MKIFKDKEKIDNRIKLIFLLSILFSITFFLFAPSMLYLTNVSAFWFTPNLLYPYILLFTGIAFIICFFCLFLLQKLNRKVADWVNFFLFVFIVGAFIQGDLIPNTKSILDGTAIDWTVINIDMILSDILWAIIILMIIVIVIKHKISIILAKAPKIIMIMLLFEFLTTGLQYLSIDKDDFNKGALATEKGEFIYSNNKNMIILLLDRLDATYLRENATEDELSCLDGFTFYYDIMGMFGRTTKAVPQLLTGQPYFYEQDYYVYLAESQDNSQLFNRLIDDDYKIGIYTIDPIAQDGEVAKYTDNNITGVLGINSRKRLFTNIYRLVAYQYSPYHIKKIFWFYPDVIYEDRKVVSSDKSFSWSMLDFYNSMDNMEVTSDKNTFKFYHLEGMHGIGLTSDCQYSAEPVELVESFHGNMALINKFINNLKDCGVYDNSIVIIMGDHGDTMDEDGFWGTNPCFMIKGLNENHDLCMSDKPLSYCDLQEIYINLLNGYKSDEATLFVPDGERNRYFYRIDPLSDNDMKLIEYESQGNAYDYNEMKETGVVYINETGETY